VKCPKRRTIWDGGSKVSCSTFYECVQHDNFVIVGWTKLYEP